MGSAASASAKVRKLSEKGDEAGLEKLLRKVKGGVGPDVIDGVEFRILACGGMVCVCVCGVRS
jgi:hypothetical protein